jgi:hypothetical protein
MRAIFFILTSTRLISHYESACFRSKREPTFGIASLIAYRIRKFDYDAPEKKQVFRG